MTRLFGILILVLLAQVSFGQIAAGPYAPPSGNPGSTAIHKDSSIIVDWATAAILLRGWQNIADTSFGRAATGGDTSVVGKAGLNGVASLGDGGHAILTFNGNLYDGNGPDFAVYENGFGTFLELAFVEVSSDGINFFRFENSSLTDTSSQIGGFGSLDATEIHNLAGKYQVSQGVPFDLSELSGTPGLDVNNISHVKIIDVIGSLQEAFVSYDSFGRPINDPWPTPFSTGGFDLDAVAAIHLTPTSIDKELDRMVHFYPNPCSDNLSIQLTNTKEFVIEVYDLTGRKLKERHVQSNSHQLDVSSLAKGTYKLLLYSEEIKMVKKLIKQ